ncbi:hypothetical protein SAMN05216498_2938 [Tenuibacillus multivorans]|uniref:Uncharacterized protein n=1 Tax=Tenuibacillus multivorans TaxID=237069 RepID=A0A1H0DT88_9BACI|nr:hypothetical protein SAMN05216498_2938 [Tenuibacillus multivorans]
MRASYLMWVAGFFKTLGNQTDCWVISYSHEALNTENRGVG